MRRQKSTNRAPETYQKRSKTCMATLCINYSLHSLIHGVPCVLQPSKHRWISTRFSDPPFQNIQVRGPAELCNTSFQFVEKGFHGPLDERWRGFSFGKKLGKFSVHQVCVILAVCGLAKSCWKRKFFGSSTILVVVGSFVFRVRFMTSAAMTGRTFST